MVKVAKIHVWVEVEGTRLEERLEKSNNYSAECWIGTMGGKVCML
jgi:hypothetical protein